LSHLDHGAVQLFAVVVNLVLLLIHVDIFRLHVAGKSDGSKHLGLLLEGASVFRLPLVVYKLIKVILRDLLSRFLELLNSHQILLFFPLVVLRLLLHRGLFINFTKFFVRHVLDSLLAVLV